MSNKIEENRPIANSDSDSEISSVEEKAKANELVANIKSILKTNNSDIKDKPK